jgi:hypothetical protein
MPLKHEENTELQEEKRRKGEDEKVEQKSAEIQKEPQF